jgi:hypothetical protein
MMATRFSVKRMEFGGGLATKLNLSPSRDGLGVGFVQSLERGIAAGQDLRSSMRLAAKEDPEAHAAYIEAQQAAKLWQLTKGTHGPKSAALADAVLRFVGATGARVGTAINNLIEQDEDLVCDGMAEYRLTCAAAMRRPR